jgi:hypothetical protein
MLAPLVCYLAGAPIRKELSHLHLIDTRALSPAEFVRHAQESARGSLRRDRRAAERPTR